MFRRMTRCCPTLSVLVGYHGAPRADADLRQWRRLAVRTLPASASKPGCYRIMRDLDYWNWARHLDRPGPAPLKPSRSRALNCHISVTFQRDWSTRHQGLNRQPLFEPWLEELHHRHFALGGLPKPLEPFPPRLSKRTRANPRPLASPRCGGDRPHGAFGHRAGGLLLAEGPAPKEPAAATPTGPDGGLSMYWTVDGRPPRRQWRSCSPATLFGGTPLSAPGPEASSTLAGDHRWRADSRGCN